MSDPTAQEPTMEEILASIRRIISEDDAPAAESTAVAAPETETVAHEPPVQHETSAPVAAPAPSPPHLAAVQQHEEDGEDDVLDLTEPAPKPAETHGDLDVFAAEPSSHPRTRSGRPAITAHASAREGRAGDGRARLCAVFFRRRF